MSPKARDPIVLRVRPDDDGTSRICDQCGMRPGRWFTVTAVPGATPEADDEGPTGNVVMTLDCDVHPSGTVHLALRQDLAELLADDLRAGRRKPAPVARAGSEPGEGLMADLQPDDPFAPVDVTGRSS